MKISSRGFLCLAALLGVIGGPSLRGRVPIVHAGMAGKMTGFVVGLGGRSCRGRVSGRHNGARGMTMGRTIVVGDVHGCREEVEALLRLTSFKPDDDRLVFVGDLVAKGPDSIGVIRLASSLGATAVSGNHEQKILRCAQHSGSECPPAPFLTSEHWILMEEMSVKEDVWRYLSEMPLFLRLPELESIVVHAGMLPGVLPEDMNPFDITTIRSVMETGEASPKKGVGKAWTELWDGPERVIYGHDAERGLQVGEKHVGIDTGCVYGGRLTAFVMPGKSGKPGDIWSVQANRKYVKILNILRAGSNIQPGFGRALP